MKTTRFFFSILTALLLVAGLFTALPADSVSAQTGGPEIYHGAFGEAPHVRVDSNAVAAYKAESLKIQAGGYVSDTNYHTMESTIISFGGSYDYNRGGYIYTQTVVTGLQAGDIVEVDNNQFYNPKSDYYSYWDQTPYWFLVGDYTHVPGDTINHWLIYSEKVNETEYRLVIGSAQYNLATNTDDLTTVIGDSFKQTRDVKVYRGPTLANPVVSSRGYTASTNEDTSSWGSPIASSSFDSGDLNITAVQETWVDDSWAGSSNGDIVEGHVFGQDAFATIQQAVTGTDSGGTVNVAAGTYNEALTINKALTLTGAGDEVTIIDGTGLTAETLVSARNLTSGTLSISGFTFKDDPNSTAALTYPVSIYNCQSPALASFTDNTIIGTGSSDKDWGLLVQGGDCSHTINNNVFDNVGGNSTLIEIATGNVEIGYNTFLVPDGNTGPAIWSMSYGTESDPNTVTGLHWYHHNSIQCKVDGGTIRGGIGFAPAFGESAWNQNQYGSYTNVLVENNTIEDFFNSGVQVEVDGLNSTFNGVIQNNILTAAPAQPNSKGIRLLGPVSNTSLLGNVITNGYRGIYLSGTWGQPIYPADITIKRNQLAGNTIGYEELDAASDQDASPNWWGSIIGPAAGYVAGNINYDPWCGDAACSFLVSATEPAESGFYVQNGELRVKGNINIPGGIVINELHLTILLEDGTVIQNNSPCFIVNASYTTITTESIGGAQCVPTSGSNGIDVASSLSNIVIEGIEFVGTTGTDGIHFAGAITDIVIVDNWFHNFTDDGMELTAQPAGVINIQGNLFQNNTGLGINAGSFTVDAEYNSWGHVDGAAAGDGASSGVSTSPWTHVDLYLVSSSTPWANQVVSGQTITYTVYAHLVNALTADITLVYPANLTLSGSPVNSGTFSEIAGFSLGTNSIQFHGMATGPTPLTGTYPIFSATFTAGDPVVAAPLNLDELTDGLGMAGYESSSNIYAATLLDSTVTIISALPTITSTDIQGYYLTGDSQEFHVRTVNPAGGGIYQHAIFNYRIAGADLADIASFEVLSGTTWVPMPLTVNGTDLVGSFGLAPTGFTMPEPYDITTTFRITFNTAKSYPFTLTLNDLDADDYTLATLSSTASVYIKPAISSATLSGPFQQGLAQAVTINVDNISAMYEPNSFVLHLGLPEGTKVVYGENTYTCGTAGCDIPVTLTAGANPLALMITFPAAFTGSITVDLYDSYLDPDRLLATLTQTDVVVYANVGTVTDTVSMQGRTFRGGVVMTLTGSVGFGPYTATSVNQLSDNLVFNNLAAGNYTITVSHDRYLPLHADLGKTKAIDGESVVLPPLELIAGDASPDGSVDAGDASVVGGYYGQTGDLAGDLNFSGKVDILDMALLGGNYLKTSAGVYASWLQ